MLEIEGYQVLITWSDEDECYLVSIPRLEQEEHVIMPCGHGYTYAEAVESARISIGFTLRPELYPPLQVA